MIVRNLFFLLVISLFVASCGDDGGTTPPVTTPVITVNDVTTTEGDASLSLSVTLTLSEPAASNIVFNYSTVAGTAQPGSDFIALDNEEFVISAGLSSANLFITILGDNVEENDENFELAFINPVGATFANSRATITIQDNDSNTGSGTTIPTTGYTTPDNYPNMTLAWADEFSNNTLSSDWTQEIGTGQSGWGNNELQYYRAQNTTFQDGNLIITARNDGFGGKAYTSSRIITQGQQSFKYGRVDIRAVLPKGQGVWPALWMLGDNFSTVGWPACGEIDIMELLGQQANKIYGTTHWEQGGHVEYGGSTTLSSGDFSQEFHVFSIIWDDQKIQWLLDDTVFHVIDTTPAALSEFQEKFFFIFNVAVGGNWPGSPNATTTFPQRMIVDYVRVFQ